MKECETGTRYWERGHESGDPVGYVYARAINAPASDPGTEIVSVDQGTHGEVKAFVAGASALYWYTIDGGADEVRTTPLSGGTPTAVPVGTIASGLTNSRVVLRTMGNTLYCNQEVGTSFANGIYRWAPGDAAGTQLVVYEGVRDFLVDANFIYYTDGGNKTFKAPIVGGAGVEIAGVGGHQVHSPGCRLHLPDQEHLLRDQHLSDPEVGAQGCAQTRFSRKEIAASFGASSLRGIRRMSPIIKATQAKPFCLCTEPNSVVSHSSGRSCWRAASK